MIQNLKQPQVSAVKLREWQRYRGWKIRILSELEHSGGMSTRDISTRIGYQVINTGNRLREMLRSGLIERVERWGWRITLDGVFLLSIQYATTLQQQCNNNATTLQQQEKKEPAPSCFHAPTCHIKQLCQVKKYTIKTRVVCQHCIWDSPHPWITSRVPVETKPVG